MKSALSLSLLFLLTGLWGSTALEAQVPGDRPGVPRHEMPSILHDLDWDTEWPLFVAADALFNASGELIPGILRPDDARTLRDIVASLPATGCHRIPAGPRESSEPLPEDLESAVQAADWVIEGTVTGTSPGFRTFHPGTLVRFMVDRTFKGEALPGEEYFFWLDLGEIRVGNRRLCKLNPGHAGLPRLGDRILVMPNRWTDDGIPIDTDDFLIVDGDASLLLLGRGEDNDAVTLPEVLSRNPKAPPHSKALLDWVASLTQGDS